MNFLNPFFIFRLVLGLIAGFLLVRRLRGPLRAIVIRMMPVHKRISADSFNIQTRLSTVLSFLLILAITVITDWGILKVSETFGWYERDNVKKSEYASVPVEVENTFTFHETPEEYSFDNHSSEKDSSATTSPKIIQLPPQFALQIYAFTKEERAITQVNFWRKRTKYKVWTTKINGTEGPYKVLIGPFDSREEALHFRNQQRLKGFPTPLTAE